MYGGYRSRKDYEDLVRRVFDLAGPRYEKSHERLMEEMHVVLGHNCSD